MAELTIQDQYPIEGPINKVILVSEVQLFKCINIKSNVNSSLITLIKYKYKKKDT